MSDYSNAIRMGIFTVAIYIAAQTTGLRYLYYLAYVLAAVLVAAFVWARLSRRDLSVSRSVQPAQAQVGGVVEETIEIQNLSRVRKLWLEVRDRSTLPGHHIGAVISLKGHGGKRWRVKTRCTHRGLYRLGPTAILTGDPFGLVQTGRMFEESAELLVYPAIVPLESFGMRMGELPGGGRMERRSFHSTPNAAGIRLYQPGDPMNRIHWPMSARTQQLMVKEFELDPTADIWLILDLNEEVHIAAPEHPVVSGTPVRQKTGWMPGLTRRPGEEAPSDREELGLLMLEPSTEEYSVVVAASLAAYFLGEGKSVGMIAWGQHRVTIPADRGGRQLIKMLRALAVLRAEGDVPLEEVLVGQQDLFSKQDTLVIVTPSLDETWVAALQLQLYRSASAAVVLVEAGTFGGGGNPLLTVSALSALNVTSYLVKRDDAIDAALHQQFGGPAVRNLR
jgi:uncharacterized protein (DUF58 family)